MFALLTDWQDQDPTGWLVSEKLDGWRVMWTGKDYVTRGGKTLYAPRSWYRSMPKTALDGELYGGAGSFYEIPGMVRRGWKGLAFHPFDAPVGGSFSERLDRLSKLSLPGHCQPVQHAPCAGADALAAAAASIYAAGGEGCVVRDPQALYATGRTKSIQRLVPFPMSLHRRPVKREAV